MAFIENPVQIASRKALDKADVELVYNDLVRLIGGTSYTNGTPSGPTNGTLDSRNFHPNAGIPNTLKSAPYSYFTIRLNRRIIGSGVNNVRVALPSSDVIPGFSGILTAWTFTVGSCTSPNSFTVKLFYRRGGANTQIGTTATLNNIATPRTVLKNESGLSVALVANDILFLEVDLTSGGPIGDGVGIALIKALHVR